MGQRPDAKTIAFAMKCFDLIHKAKTDSYARIVDAPIIVDLRIVRISLTSGLLRIPARPLPELLQDATNVATAYHAHIVDAWRLVHEGVRDISLFRIDSLLWQVAELISENRGSRSEALARTASALVSTGLDQRAARLVATELTAALV
jgi:N-glycosylase/DNA lyase